MASIDDTDRKFYQIEQLGKKLKHLIPADNSNHLRKVILDKRFSDILNTIHNELKNIAKSSGKERLDQITEILASEENNLKLLLEIASTLKKIKDKNVTEKKIFQDIVSSISLEYAFVFKTDQKQAEKIVKDSFQ